MPLRFWTKEGNFPRQIFRSLPADEHTVNFFLPFSLFNCRWCHATSLLFHSVHSLESPETDWLIFTLLLVLQTQFTWFKLLKMSADSLSSSSRSFYERSKGKLNISLVLAAASMMLLGFCGVAGGKVSCKICATDIYQTLYSIIAISLNQLVLAFLRLLHTPQ